MLLRVLEVGEGIGTLLSPFRLIFFRGLEDPPSIRSGCSCTPCCFLALLCFLFLFSGVTLSELMFLAPGYDQVDFMVPEYLGLPSEILAL